MKTAFPLSAEAMLLPMTTTGASADAPEQTIYLRRHPDVERGIPTQEVT